MSPQKVVAHAILMRGFALVAAALLATACDKPPASSSATPPQPETPPVGRWLIVPAVHAPVNIAGTNYLFAWKLDTQTGELHACTYDPGGWKTNDKLGVASEKLTCLVETPY